ncbi:PREDICTED: legumin type B-like isoform X2 [Lupinus angustifolius]|uniref:legumin type B-like isoform X2 n=1 Tax=Lupinus angustifolius TaxID=3871 RepID=UPI00092EE1E1|nr:PREDICTED: legumin type B-like isoform X2 [Lupinus angustifolius]
MANPFLLSLSLCLVLLYTSACLGEGLDRFNECQLDRLNALEPDNRIESEGGVTETWNSNKPELRCAGVAFEKHTIEPKGLHLPSYTNYPQIIMIVQGEGALGISVPGCTETFEEAQQSSQSQEQEDSHQKIRHFREGDILVIPPGTPYWTYNYGDEQLVAINLLDTTSLSNQLDPNPRRFYLAGNPEEEYPETQQQRQQRQQHQRPSGRRHGQHQKEEEQEGKNNILSGFDPQFLSQALNIDEDTVHKLQNPNERIKQIIRVEEGLGVISPKWQEQEEEEEEKEEPRQRRRRERREEREEEEKEEEDEPRESRRHRGGHEEEEVEEERGRGRGGSEWKRTTRRRHTRGDEGQEEEETTTTTEERRRRRGGRGSRQEEEEEQSPPRSRNGLEETICTAILRENIADPTRADLYNPTAGRISTANSLTLPILGWFQLSAEYVNLYRNGIYAPHWNINANSVIYVIRGRGRVQVVNSQGNSVFNDDLRRGQLLVVPQNFVVAHQAGDEGFEFIAFKTNDQATTSPLKQVFRGIPAEVLANAFRLSLNQVSELKYNGNHNPLVTPQSQSQDHNLVKVA